MHFDEFLHNGVEPRATDLAPRLVEVLEANGVATREQLIQHVEVAWAEAGNPPIDRAKTTTRVKKALQVLRQQGIAENFTYGYWRLTASGDEEAALEALDDSTRNDDGETASLLMLSPLDPAREDVFTPEATCGEGEQSVYAYYLPTYRRLAEIAGDSRWPMKVGMTTTSVSTRIGGQLTALPEGPVVGVVLRSSNAALLEKVLHGILSIRGRQVNNGGGTEWFLTSPDELVSLHRMVLSIDG